MVRYRYRYVICCRMTHADLRSMEYGYRVPGTHTVCSAVGRSVAATSSVLTPVAPSSCRIITRLLAQQPGNAWDCSIQAEVGSLTHVPVELLTGTATSVPRPFERAEATKRRANPQPAVGCVGLPSDLHSRIVEVESANHKQTGILPQNPCDFNFGRSLLAQFPACRRRFGAA